MMTERMMQGLVLLFLGIGAAGASRIANVFDNPSLAGGWALATLIFVFVGILKLLRPI